MYTYVIVVFPIPHPPLIHKVKNFGKPTWRRLVGAVEDDAGGNNPAPAQTIARDRPGEPGNLIHQLAKPYGRSSVNYLFIPYACLNLVEVIYLALYLQ